MGLDMFAYVTKPANLEADPDDPGAVRLKDHNAIEELCYWRKFNALHGWMEDLYKSRGGNSEFNLIKIDLRNEDLDRLESDMKENRLRPTAGFFFGAMEIDPSDLKSLGSFIGMARTVLANGEAVVYDSWW